ncbi:MULTISPECIES: efflux RND transporter periplasmic adaptor subunit [Legionella]|uniref:efflux RND transporter periplasmic adaptor subunit n=1 Tax=Legionella TaxID=445 RepID=UPI000F8F4DD3|nr:MULTISPECIES: efflux RND transporter periplasmic adaptor subunit [Legionella]MCP0913370.1 efflux RND transporter periplasmic adaptor subunit [Legionella sp. 27cVA30]RUQ95168.1 efflux RND transporter periplasmic adaptor subunit [Legionella septentrionalis]RUR08983.1 efflux RND transporter periplasmic adaptor subunit [Legionella septentrionalis]RUR14881.1 efflux RND transporter periplasmic adaptor subunit [Legionella septentrionalis]
MKKRYLTRLVLIIFSTCLIIGFLITHRKHESHKKEIPEILITNPWTETLTIDNGYVAQIKSIQHIQVRSLEKGYLQHIYIDEGQFVQKGQKMFQIMPLVLQVELEKAKAEYEISRIEYENTKNLESKQVVSPNELALAKAKLDKTRTKMKLAEIHLQFTTITAPFDGIVDRFRVRVGSLIEEGQLLTTMSDNSRIWVYFNVSEVDYLNFMKKQNAGNNFPLKLELANGQNFNQEGRIDTVEADFDNATGNIAFRASFPNPENLLRHGQTGTIILSERLKNALVIPQKATFEVLDKKFVYVVDEKNVIKSREIAIAHEVPHLYVIRSGLTKDEKILLEGLGRVHLGQKIKPLYQKSAEVQSSLNLPVK